MAWPLAPGTDLVVQLHMVPNGAPHPIAFSVGIFLTSDPPEHAPVILRLGRRDIDIAAGQRDHVVTDSYVLPVDVVVHALKPHAHYRAREISGAAVLPDGSTRPLLLIKDWDFRWQHVYRYVVPVALPKGTTVTLRCTYDNSVSPRRSPDLQPSRIRWGPRSSDEMGDLWLQVVARSERDAAVLAADFGQKWLRDEIAGYQTLIEREPENASLHDEVAWLHVRAGRAEEAAKHYETFVRLTPDSPTGRFNLATALMLSGRLEEAAVNYLEALRLKPDYAAAHNNLGNLYGRLGRDADALEHFQATVQADPTHAGARNNIGFLLMRRGDVAGARLHLAEAMRLDPRLPDAHYNLGLLAESEGDAPAARAQFEEALRIQPDWVAPLTALGWMLAASADDRVRNASKAIQVAQRAVDLTSRRDGVALDALAAAYAEAGQFDRALDTLREALGIASGTPAEAAMLERRKGYAAGRPYRQGPEKRPAAADARGGSPGPR